MVPDAASRREQARDAWLSFVQSRLQDAASDAPNHIEALDCELELVNEFAAHIKAQRNACTWLSRLPVELLSAIFAILQRTWTPKMTRRRRIHHDAVMRQSYYGREEVYDPEKHSAEYCSYDIGWVNITHVCAAWRKIALATPTLWSDFNCSDLHTSFGAVVAERSGDQPVRLSLDYDNQPLLISSLTWTKGWLMPSNLPRLQRVELLHISESSIARVLRRMNRLPSLLDFSISLEEWEDGEKPPVILHADLPLSSPDQLERVCFINCFPPLSSPIFSSNLTSLVLEVTWHDPHPAVPTVDDMIHLLSRTPNLEHLQLENIPVPNPSDRDLQTDNQPLVLPSCLRKIDYNITEYNGSIPAALTFLRRVVLPQGVKMNLEMCQDKDKDTENAVFARVTTALFHAIDRPAGSPRRLSVSDSSATLVFDANPHDWRVNRSRSLHRELSDEDTYLSNSRNGGCGDVDASMVLRTLPLESVISLDVDSWSAESRSPGGNRWIEDVQSAQAVRHLGITLPIFPGIFQDLSGAVEANGMPFPRLESMTLKCDPNEESDDWEETKFTSTLDALVACVAARRLEAAPLRELFVDSRFQLMYPWYRFRDVDVTFYDTGT